MNQHMAAFKRMAVQMANLRPNFAERGLGDFMGMLVEKNLATPQAIALSALLYFCVEDGRFNNFQHGIVGVVSFLDERYRKTKHSEQAAHDLVRILKQGCTEEQLQKWMVAWYGQE